MEKDELRQLIFDTIVGLKSIRRELKSQPRLTAILDRQINHLQRDRITLRDENQKLNRWIMAIPGLLDRMSTYNHIKYHEGTNTVGYIDSIGVDPLQKALDLKLVKEIIQYHEEEETKISNSQT